jgi:glycosyltransferase involved in cell wall biosynthesis
VNDYRDMSSYYNALDLYAITSRDEGGPIAMMESWASGIPLVSTRVGMPADHIRHGENGLLAEIEDVEALATSAATLIDDATLRERITTQALRDVKDFSWSRIAGRYFHELYQPYLQQKG